VHLTSSPLDWYVARTAGIAAYLLVTVAVLLGLTMAGKKTFRAGRDSSSRTSTASSGCSPAASW
jgi:hypothetical protein